MSFKGFARNSPFGVNLIFWAKQGKPCDAKLKGLKESSIGSQLQSFSM